MAGNSGAIKAGQAYVELFLRKNAFTAGLKSAQAGLSSFGAGAKKVGGWMSLMGAAASAPLVSAVGLFNSMGDEMSKLADRTTMSVEALSGLKYAAEQSDVPVEALGSGLKKMLANIASARPGDWLETLQNLPPEEQFTAIAQRIAGIADPAQRAQAAMKIFGKAGWQMLPMLKDGAMGIQELIDRARELGLVMSEDDARAATNLGDVFSDLWKSVKMVAFQVGAGLAPHLQGIADSILEISGGIIRWVEANRQVAATIAAVSVGIIAIGAAITIVGLASVVTASAIGGVLTLLSGVAIVAGAVMSPVGALIVLFGTLGASAVTLGALWIGVDDAIIAGWQSLVGEATEAFSGISAAMSTGDIEGAWAIVTAFMRLEWLRVANWLQTKWDDFISFFTLAQMGLNIAFIDATAKIKTVWADLMGWMSKAWLAFENSTFAEGLADKLAPIIAFFTGTDVDEIRKNLTEDFDRKRASADDAAKGIDAETEARKAEIEKQRKGSTEMLGADFKARADARTQREQEAMRAVEEARGNLRRRVNDAVTAKETNDRDKAWMEEYRRMMADTGGGPALAALGPEMSMAGGGGFSGLGARLGGMGGETVWNEIAENTRRTADAVEAEDEF